MICPVCFGRKYDFKKDGNSGYFVECKKCHGTGIVESQTNEEYMQTCNAEELGCFICENFFHGACGECRFCEKTELRHHCILGEWLKEKYNG